jgi:16S rRNA G966 N2-methylase RsmD
VLVDQDPRAAAVENINKLELSRTARFVRSDVASALRRLEGRFDWIFVDPPYGGGELDRALRLLGDAHLLADGGTVIAEHDHKSPPSDRYRRLALADRRSWGQTSVSFYTVTDEDPA